MKRVRLWKRAAGTLLIVCGVFLYCAGCKAEKSNELQTFVLEEDGAETQQGADGTESTDAEAAAETALYAEPAQETIFVYVCGAVSRPGVYELDAGARVYEAIACAGGVREDAAEEYVNQAQTVADGERIYIPTDAEAEQGLAGIGGMGSVDADSGNTDGKVNINTASKEELKTLSGIGDAKAESIIAYREANGAFQSIEELMNVEGIKEGVFNKVKDRITVNAGS